MKIDELKTALKNEGLMKINYLGSLKYYVSGEYIYNNGQWNNIPDVFGIYKNKDTDGYCVFITDSERGFRCYTKAAATEEEACEYLIDMARKTMTASDKATYDKCLIRNDIRLIT